MKKTNAAPIAMYPTKNRKKVIVSSVLPSINSGNPLSPTGSVLRGADRSGHSEGNCGD